MQTHLWVGNLETLSDQARLLVARQICQHNGEPGCFCIDCRHIAENKHTQVIWCAPRSGYTLDDLEPIFTLTQFATTMPIFIVLASAERLNAACANRLLKLIEEPPANVTFLLLTAQERGVLPTIRSRCSIRLFAHDAEARSKLHPLIEPFLTNTMRADPLYFDQLLEQSSPDEHLTIELASQLLALLTEHAKQSSLSADNNPHAATLLRALNTITTALTTPPQAGGAILWWRTLFLVYPWQ